MTKRVAIIFGGRSSEHEISCISAGGVAAAIDKSLYEPVLIGITEQGDWVLIPESYCLAITDGVLPRVPTDAPKVVADVSGFSSGGNSLNIDLVFPILHGPYGEDGTIQGLLEMADIAYVGSGVLASAVAMDKSFAKEIFAAHSIKVAAGVVVNRSDWAENQTNVEKEIGALGYPVFVKPARGGSSRGTTKVKSASELSAAIADAHSFDSKAIVEQMIVGAEIECAVLEINGKPEASVVGQIHIDPKFEFYDFEAKYLDGATSIELPAPISESAAAEIKSSAIKAFNALGCSGLARVDFFLTENNEVILNELNTMPGFTATSVFPKMWAATGIDYSSLITYLLKSAEERSNGVLD